DRTGTGQQYDRPGDPQQHERGGTARHAAGTPRGTAKAPRGAGRAGHGLPGARGLPGGWIGEIVLGLATLVLGLIVVNHPMHSLQVLAVLLGVLMIVSGVYQVVR